MCPAARAGVAIYNYHKLQMIRAKAKLAGSKDAEKGGRWVLITTFLLPSYPDAMWLQRHEPVTCRSMQLGARRLHGLRAVYLAMVAAALEPRAEGSNWCVLWSYCE
jgi:hypothetical protein